MEQEHRPEKTTSVSEYSSCIILVLQQMFHSEYVWSQQNTPQHFRAISKPLANAEKCNHNVSQEEEINKNSKFPCTCKNKIPMKF